MSQTPRMDWNRLLTLERYGKDGPDAPSPRDPRSPFQRDYDRIVFSGHFRRLGRKTQVHPLNENDHLHTRLSHSLETASVGRSLGQAAGALLARRKELPAGLTPEHVGQVVQTACLAHDIGNPPFGHSGEGAIKTWFKSKVGDSGGLLGPLGEARVKDLTCFDGNAMALRILTRTGFDGNDDGILPTLALLGALMKYPMTSGHTKKDKFSCLQSEADVLETVAGRLGLFGEAGLYSRHPLAFLVEAADDICYRIIDLEDATELGILEKDYIAAKFVKPLQDAGIPLRDMSGMGLRSRNGYLRAKTIGEATAACAEAFEAHYDAIMEGGFKTPDGAEAALIESTDNPVCRELYRVYKEEASDVIFNSKRKVELEIGAQRSLGLLLDTFVPLALDYARGQRSGAPKQIATLLGRGRFADLGPESPNLGYRVALLVLDYLAGMTDQYATRMCRKFSGLGE